MENVIFGFSTPKKFHILPWIIRKVEKTEFSHVYIKIYSVEAQRWLIYQASGMKVNFIGADKFEETNKIIAEFPLRTSKKDKKQILQEAVDSLGIDYGMKQLMGMGLVRLCALINVKISNPFADGSATYICSEAAATILVKHFGFKLEDLDDVTPKEVYEQVDQNKKVS